MIAVGTTRWLLLATLCLCYITCDAVAVPGLEYRAYVKQGDIMLGELVQVQDRSNNGFCAPLENSTEVAFRIQMVEMMNFAVTQINNRSDLLGNITLGFVAMDLCSKDVTALARATSFVDDSECVKNLLDQNISLPKSHTQSSRDYTCKIVGLVGPQGSDESMMVSPYLGLYQIPTLALFATSDDLADREKYEYFSRLVPADSHQVEMFMEVLLTYNWTLVGLLYIEGSFGENAAKSAERLTAQNNICIEYQKRISPSYSGDDYALVAQQLLTLRSRVIIVFVDYVSAMAMFDVFHQWNLTGRFVWLCGDFIVAINEPTYGLSGAIFAAGILEPVEGFEEFYGSLSPWEVPTNPWMPKAWEDLFTCKWQAKEGESDCNSFRKISDSPIFNEPMLVTSKVYEGVLMYALALDALINSKCPDAFMNKSHLDSCVNGKDLLDYLRRVDLTPIGRVVQLDSNGETKPVLDLQQVFYQSQGPQFTTIGRWSKAGLSQQSEFQFQWMSGSEEFVNGIPESVCSKPCGPRQYRVQVEELPCCWECRECRDNEIISPNDTGCSPCPEFTWPDSDTQTICKIIPPTYLRTHMAFGRGLIVVAVSGLALAGTAVVLFVKYQHHKLIKASSRELSSVTFLGVTFALSGTFAFVVQPSRSVCWLRASVFAMSVTIIFSPILVKAIRIYRIFKAGSEGNQRLRFTSSPVQVMFAGLLIVAQVVLVVAANLSSPPTSAYYMPVETEKYVELLCDQSLVGFILPMTYNILIIVLCSALGFLTRKLPDNFNESWFIFISVATTLFMWLVFVPSYFTAFYAYLQDALLALCLVLNAYVTIVCLFWSKIYAVLCVQNLAVAPERTTTIVNSFAST